ncbi:TPA: diguanylate cyclase [Raoultella ornithinolytica]|nr:diguanylate cyclase [Raoultella ornithinolytica]HAT1615971.1 diguanylate cyclase [Raoultella ornithinolytica]
MDTKIFSVNFRYINTLIVILTTSIFIGLITREYHDLKRYMGYVVENGRSALSHAEYINQNMALQLSRAFSVLPASPGVQKNKRDKVCEHLQSANGVQGLNLTNQTYRGLNGTLQTRNADCQVWAEDVSALSVIQNDHRISVSKYTFSSYRGYIFNNIRYYIDLINNYIYINKIIDANKYQFDNWLVRDDNVIDITRSAHTISIDRRALNDLLHGENITSHIYRDGYTKKNIISMLTPVFQNGLIKGIIVTDVNIDDLTTAFYTADRPVLWRFLSLYVTDESTAGDIYFHRSILQSINIIKYQANLTPLYKLNVKLDLIYFIINNLWLVFIYALSTWLLCRYTKKQMARHAELSKDNITDTMTGLYNRKVLNDALSHKIDAALAKHIPVTLVSIDSDGLKKINDTLGHHMGDKVIQSLGRAIEQSIRKSDYGIRAGGDEFLLILFDTDYAKSLDVIARIKENLRHTDKDKRVSFSHGNYPLETGDSLESAINKSDQLLYVHKRNKHAVPGK